MSDSNQHLWRRIRKGDKKAFEVLYKTYFSPLCLYAYGFIPDEELIKEIVNDVFLRIWQKHRDIEIKYGIKPYLYRCIHNACMDYLEIKKTIKKNKITSISAELLELTGDDEEFILERLILKDVEKDVLSGINKLPPQCREVFILSRYEMLSYNEISEKLNISVNTVKTQISRALESLRINLKKYL